MTKTTQHDIGITRRAAVAASKVEFATQDAIEVEMCVTGSLTAIHWPTNQDQLRLQLEKESKMSSVIP